MSPTRSGRGWGIKNTCCIVQSDSWEKKHVSNWSAAGDILGDFTGRWVGDGCSCLLS